MVTGIVSHPTQDPWAGPRPNFFDLARAQSGTKLIGLGPARHGPCAVPGPTPRHVGRIGPA
jgi:hypothetical protein